MAPARVCVVPADNPGGAIPATLHPTAIGLKVTGIGSCASSAAARTADAAKANAFALSGKLTIKMLEIDSLGKNFQTQAYVTIKGFDPASTDVLQFTGIVVKGPSAGATVSGKLYMDAVTKISPDAEAARRYRIRVRRDHSRPLHRRHREQRVGAASATR